MTLLGSLDSLAFRFGQPIHQFPTFLRRSVRLRFGRAVPIPPPTSEEAAVETVEHKKKPTPRCQPT